MDPAKASRISARSRVSGNLLRGGRGWPRAIRTADIDHTTDNHVALRQEVDRTMQLHLADLQRTARGYVDRCEVENIVAFGVNVHGDWIQIGNSWRSDIEGAVSAGRSAVEWLNLRFHAYTSGQT